MGTLRMSKRPESERQSGPSGQNESDRASIGRLKLKYEGLNGHEQLISLVVLCLSIQEDMMQNFGDGASVFPSVLVRPPVQLMGSLCPGIQELHVVVSSSNRPPVPCTTASSARDTLQCRSHADDEHPTSSGDNLRLKCYNAAARQSDL